MLSWGQRLNIQLAAEMPREAVPPARRLEKTERYPLPANGITAWKRRENTAKTHATRRENKRRPRTETL